MKFKSYSGRTVAELVPKIRAELGPEAVILKQRPTRLGGVGGFFAHSGVEVLAADAMPDAGAAVPEASERRVDVSDADTSRDELLRQTFADALAARVEPDPAPEAEVSVEPAGALALGAPAPPPEPVVAAATAHEAYTGRVRPFEPVRINSTRAASGMHVGPNVRQEPVLAPLDEESEGLALELERCGVSRRAAEALVREVRFHVQPFGDDSLRDAARRRIASRIRVEQGWVPAGTARRVAVIGGSGSGKTTAVANLAAAFGAAAMTVGIVIVARRDEGDQMLPRLGAAGGSQADHALAYMAGADVCRVASGEEARRGLARLAARDVVLIDTPGVQPDGDEAVAEILRSAAPDEIHATVPLGIAEREAAALLARLERLGANRLLVTRTDEARFAGPLYELATTFEMPLGYLGCGPNVPGGLKPADGGSIAARILPM
jgi:flagellar biosynthesis protein FlhF